MKIKSLINRYPLLLAVAMLVSFWVPKTSMAFAETKTQNSPNHAQWDALLKKHVNQEGLVNYKGFIKDKQQLESYLKLLQTKTPDPKSWNKEEQLAFWINAYNAYTVKLIIDNYPLKSIQELDSKVAAPTAKSIWDHKFIPLLGKKMSLNMIEHDILRKEFNEPRIHFAINCASISCPVLLNEAFTASKLERQLDKQTNRFINDPSKNKLSAKSPKVSSIFNWFGDDFKKNESLIHFLNRYAKVKIDPNATLTFLAYNWDLNEQK